MPLQGQKQATFFPYILAGMLFLVSLITTWGLWRAEQAAALKELRDGFDFRARQTIDRIDRRMATYEQALRATRGFLDSSMEVTYSEYRSFISELRLQEYYPGIQAIAVSQVVWPNEKERHVDTIRRQGHPDYAIRPPGEREFYTTISHIEPYTGFNPRALGFDMFTEPVRRAAMERARDTGRAALSGKVRLIQEIGDKPQAGFVMYVPLYQRDLPTATLEQRRAAISGWIGGAFRMNDLMAGLYPERSDDIVMKIYDGTIVAPENLLYESANANLRDPSQSALFSSMRQISIAGYPWIVHIESSPSFERQLDADGPRVIAISGVVGSLLLSLLVWTLATGRRRAITLATAMTEELRASEFRWKYALEGAGDGVWDWDMQTGEVAYSRQWKAMLGYGENEIENTFPQWERLVHPADKPGALAALDAYLAGSAPSFAIEHRLLCKDGSWKWIFSRGTVVNRSDDGVPLRIIGTHSDITGRKEAERREIERLQQLDETRAALHHSQKLEAVGKLTGGVAHDFNNALQIIGANLELLQGRLRENSEAQALLNSARLGVERGAKLSSQLLAFARRQPLQPRVVNMRRMMLEMHDLLRSVLGESVEIRTTISDNLANTYIDPNQLENVIVNLALNSRDAMDGRGCLMIQVCNEVVDQATGTSELDVPAGQYVLLSIADTGSGMTKEVMEQAFEPFFTTKPQGQGTGLGLSMAYGFVKQSGGQIRIESRIGEGTTVRIYLPCTLEAESEPAAPGTSQPAAGGTETILVVEDDAEVRSTVVAMLTGLGYRVLMAHDGDAALQVLRERERIDLLFTDVIMPGRVQSPDLAEQARQLFPDIAVLFTSGYTRNFLLQNGHLDPKVNLLSKPYRREQLAARIRTALGEKKPGNRVGASRSADSASREASGRSKRRILVVEDNHDMKTLACQMLAALGYEAYGAATAEEALKILEETIYDVLLTDIELPGMDGVALARECRRSHPDIRVIFASGYGDTVNTSEVAGSVILSKPYTLAQMQSALQGHEAAAVR